MEKQNLLNFLRFDVAKVLFDRGETKFTGQFNINITNSIEVAIEDDSIFKSVFFVNITDDSNVNFSFQIKAIGYFKIIGEPEKKIRDNFIDISAPSIIYPYLRAFISNFFLQAGMLAIVLPPMNFGANKVEPKPFNAPKALVGRPLKKKK